MKLKGLNYSLSMMGVLLALTGSDVYAGAMGPAVVGAPGKIYLGVFGGGGTSTRTDVSQYATAFFIESQNGPLAVNGFGRTNSRSVGMVGGHIGYQWAEIMANPLNAQWGLVPAFELEGYYLGKSNFTMHEISSDTDRLDAHDFLITMPMKSGVFLTNAVLNFNSANSRLQPYVGAGIGGAVMSVNDATSFQVVPLEVGVNHFGANVNAKDSAFAGQVKVGLNYNFTQNISIFGEYRWLYVAASEFTFGSTVFPGHAATSPWSVHMDSQNYNMGALGLHYTV